MEFGMDFRCSWVDFGRILGPSWEASWGQGGTKIRKARISRESISKSLKKQVEELLAKEANSLQKTLKDEFETIAGVEVLTKKLPLNDQTAIKTLGSNLQNEVGESIIGFGWENDGKAMLMLFVSEGLTSKYKAGQLIREISKNIQGGGGGQNFFATAGGKNPDGIDAALEEMKKKIQSV